MPYKKNGKLQLFLLQPHSEKQVQGWEAPRAAVQSVGSCANKSEPALFTRLFIYTVV